MAGTVFPQRLVKAFFALFRKEYSIKITKQTDPSYIAKQVKKTSDNISRMTNEERKRQGVLFLYKKNNSFRETINTFKEHAIWSKSKKGKEYVRFSVPWTQQQKLYIKEHNKMGGKELHRSFSEKFGDIRTLKAAQIEKSRSKRR